MSFLDVSSLHIRAPKTADTLVDWTGTETVSPVKDEFSEGTESATITREPLIGGLRPDFLIETPDGRRIVVEAKAGSSAADTERAARQATLLKNTTGADEALIVMEGIERADEIQGVIGYDRWIEYLTELGIDLQSATTHTLQTRAGNLEPGRRIFAAMPFSEEFDDTFFVGITPACESIQASARRVDQESYTGDVVARIQAAIHESIAVIADVSGARPNVLYELGLAHGMGKPSINISSTPPDQLPFDIRNTKILTYAAGQTHRLKTALVSELTGLSLGL